MEESFLIAMFFKREQTEAPKYASQINSLKLAGFETRAADGATIVRRGGFVARLLEGTTGVAEIADSGLALGDEIAVLTDLGFQKIFLTPGGKKTPALAEHLKGLHSFVEGIQKSLGLTRFYNDGLGTTNEKHIYDRVEGRDQGPSPRPWDKPAV